MKNKALLLTLPIFAFCLSSCGNGVRHPTTEYKAGEISITSGDDFNILQLTDIHLSNKDNQKLQLDFLDLTISEAKNKGANLIVLTGDTFTFATKETAKTFFSFLDSYQIPWTVTFGNHDEQCLFSVTWLTSFLNNYDSEYCMFNDLQDDDVFGSANFYIDVKQDDTLFERVIIMDSNRYHFSTDYLGYDYFKQDQIDWYERVINDSSSTDSVLFFHIPLPEFLDAYNARKEGKILPEDDFGGENYEGISCPKYNSGFFDKIMDLGSTKGIFVGHDHENDSVIRYKGVILGYGTNSSDRIYYKEGMMGGLLIKIKADHSYQFERIHHSYSEVEGK